MVLISDGALKPEAPGSLREVMPTSLAPRWERFPLSFGLFMSGVSITFILRASTSNLALNIARALSAVFGPRCRPVSLPRHEECVAFLGLIRSAGLTLPRIVTWTCPVLTP